MNLSFRSLRIVAQRMVPYRTKRSAERPSNINLGHVTGHQSARRLGLPQYIAAELSTDFHGEFVVGRFKIQIQMNKTLQTRGNIVFGL